MHALRVVAGGGQAGAGRGTSGGQSPGVSVATRVSIIGLENPAHTHTRVSILGLETPAHTHTRVSILGLDTPGHAHTHESAY